MSGGYGEIIEAIGGILIGGFVLLVLAQELNTATPIDLKTWGVIYLGAGVIITVLAIVAAIISLLQ